MFQKVQLDKKKYGRDSQTFFKVYCPSQYNHHPQKLMMQDNGSVSKNVEYKSICTEKFLFQIAYNNDGVDLIEAGQPLSTSTIVYYKCSNSNVIDDTTAYDDL